MTDLLHQEFEPNLDGRDFVVGNIHGMHDKLQEALQVVRFNAATDRLFSTGGLVNYGDQWRESLALAEHAWFHPVRGAVENTLLYMLMTGMKLQADPHNPDLLEEFRQVGDETVRNGGRWLVELLADGEGEEYTEEVAAAVLGVEQSLRWPGIITVRHASGMTFGVVPAEYPLGDWEERETIEQVPEFGQSLLYGSSRLRRQVRGNVDNVDLIICGHTEVSEPVVRDNHLWINTAPEKPGGSLTLIELDAAARLAGGSA